MKKEDITGLIVWLLLAALAAVFFFVVLRDYYQTSQGFPSWVAYVGFYASAMVGGIIFNAALYELAHVLGAKIGGYKVTSVNILGFNFYKDGNKTKFKLSSYDGLCGETKIFPKTNTKKEPNPNPFLMLGTVFFAVEIVLAVFFWNIMKSMENPWVKNWSYFILTVGVAGAIILIYNILPFHLDNMTDGYRLRMVSNAKNRKAFNDLLRSEGQLSGEVTVEETNDTTKVEEEEDTAFSADLSLNRVYRLLDKREYAKAEELLDVILSSGNVAKKVFIRARAQKIYINLMTKSLEEANSFYENEVPIAERREISEDNDMASIRAYILMSGLLDKSKSECLYTLKKVNKALKHTVEQRRNIEIELFNETIDKVHAAHPKWELDQYKIQ